jgi:hypothetical protein
MEPYKQKQSPLGEAFGFTENDLAENRRGNLTDAQMANLRRSAGQIALIVIGVLGAVGVLTIFSAQPDSSEVPVFLLCLGVPALVTLAFTVFATEAALVPRVVAKSSGVVHLAYGMFAYTPRLDEGQQRIRRRFRFGRMGGHTMIIGDQEFTLTRDQWSLLKAGSYANIYYLPTLHKIVSIEIIAQDIQAPEPEIVHVDAGTPSLPAPSRGDDEGDIIRG